MDGMKIFLLGLLLLTSTQVFSQQIGEEDITLTIDEMVKNNIISESEGQRAKIKIRKSNKAFLKSTNRMPASVHSQLIDSSSSSDISSVQMKQIEKQIDIIFRKVVDK